MTYHFVSGVYSPKGLFRAIFFWPVIFTPCFLSQLSRSAGERPKARGDEKDDGQTEQHVGTVQKVVAGRVQKPAGTGRRRGGHLRAAEIRSRVLPALVVGRQNSVGRHLDRKTQRSVRFCVKNVDKAESRRVIGARRINIMRERETKEKRGKRAKM